MMKTVDTLTIHQTTSSRIPKVNVVAIKNGILGKRYTLSVVYVPRARMQALNKTYRKKDAPTDILAFPLSNTSGEIVIHYPTVKKKSKLFSLTPRAYLTYIFIHGCLHLKGMDHGRTMEKLEDRWCRTFRTPPPAR